MDTKKFVDIEKIDKIRMSMSVNSNMIAGETTDDYEENGIATGVGSNIITGSMQRNTEPFNHSNTNNL